MEMDTYEGVCKYCGETQPIMAMDQMDANEKISEQCACGGAEMERRKNRLLENVKETAGAEAANFGHKQLAPEQEKLIEEMALAVFHGHAAKVTCKFEGTTITAWEAGGKVKLQRVDAKKTERSA